MQDKHRATKVTLYMPQELHRQLKIRSAVDGEPMSTLAERALEFYLSHSDVVEEYSSYGSTHRVYSCPSCSESLVMREEGLVPVSDVTSSSYSPDLHVEVQEVPSEESRPEEGQLVPC
ncbi:MAG: hypothetical protein F6K42_13910 [Leptolyngbya sp. SIO1D8]|nr:hypothetical protein [Leptolyngbya sp. SIO1D8]